MVYLRSLDDTIQIRVEEGQNILVGRLLKCDMVLEDGSVSSQHARLHLQDNRLRLVEMGSTNGTRVNYGLINDPVYLMDGDTVEFGNVTFTVDGPGLECPSAETEEDFAPVVDPEPLEASQKLDATMAISLPPEEELENELRHEPAPEETDDSETDPDTEEAGQPFEDPVAASFWISLALLLLAGVLIWVGLWNDPLTF